MDSCMSYYAALHNKCFEILEASFGDKLRELQNKNHNFIDDFIKLTNLVNIRPGQMMLGGALHSYEHALLSLVHGQYRLAFVGLRQFLELTLAAIYLSAYEIDLRCWQRDDLDIIWRRIVDREKGLFSKLFAQAFYEELEECSLSFLGLSEKVYRECSEYVHCNAKTVNHLPVELKFSEELFRAWHSKASTIQSVVIFAFCLRYSKSIEADQMNSVRDIMLDRLSHIEDIRRNYSLLKREPQ